MVVQGLLSTDPAIRDPIAEALRSVIVRTKEAEPDQMGALQPMPSLPPLVVRSDLTIAKKTKHMDEICKELTVLETTLGISLAERLFHMGAVVCVGEPKRCLYQVAMALSQRYVELNGADQAGQPPETLGSLLCKGFSFSQREAGWHETGLIYVVVQACDLIQLDAVAREFALVAQRQHAVKVELHEKRDGDVLSSCWVIALTPAASPKKPSETGEVVGLTWTKLWQQMDGGASYRSVIQRMLLPDSKQQALMELKLKPLHASDLQAPAVLVHLMATAVVELFHEHQWAVSMMPTSLSSRRFGVLAVVQGKKADQDLLITQHGLVPGHTRGSIIAAALEKGLIATEKLISGCAPVKLVALEVDAPPMFGAVLSLFEKIDMCRIIRQQTRHVCGKCESETKMEDKRDVG
jgi:hypothetical protein